MATDTACQRYLYYHTAEDTPDKVNFPRLAEATGSLYRCCTAMAEEGLDAITAVALLQPARSASRTRRAKPS